jgi:coenzyme Q-binding protein COQ10
MERPGRILVQQMRGPFRKLSNTWRFAPQGEGACEVKFAIDFAFQSRLLNRMVGGVFERAFQQMVASFEERAAEVYAGPNQRIV